MDRESKKLVCPECHSEDYIVFSEQEIVKGTIGTPIAIIDSAQIQIQGDLKDCTIQKEEASAEQVLE